MTAMQGKVVVVTGATSGLGRLAAIRLAEMGARLVMIARHSGRAEQVLAQLYQAGPGVDHTVHLADLSLIGEVKRVGGEIAAAEPHIDVLINNAGSIFGSRRVTSEGLELTFATNHMAYFVLTHMLLERLKASAPARIVNTASGAHFGKRLDFDDLQATRGYRAQDVYGRSKLCNILFTRELARRLEGSGISANAVGPARTTATRFAHNVHPLAAVAMHVASPFLLSVDKGAAPIVHLCASPDLDGVNGTYWSGWKQPHLTAAATSAADAERLWRLSAELTGVDLPA
jgi:NAD(P)-dependent dehydrogenase (short-subunit alcohol dehydrogenase family)